MDKLKWLIAAAFAAQVALASAHPGYAAGPAPESSGPPPATLEGEVMEVQDAGGYTYLRIRTARGLEWAAVTHTELARGMHVTIGEPAEMRDFPSKALGRTFEVIYFGTVLGTDAAVRMPDGAAIKVDKAAGADARTVAEVYAESSALKDKPVTIRAKVASISPNVMGRTWVHLRDGSGSTADRTFDLIVLAANAPKVGDVVVARGVVRTEVDLGMGHAFKVVLEDATFN